MSRPVDGVPGVAAPATPLDGVADEVGAAGLPVVTVSVVGASTVVGAATVTLFVTVGPAMVTVTGAPATVEIDVVAVVRVVVKV